MANDATKPVTGEATAPPPRKSRAGISFIVGTIITVLACIATIMVFIIAIMCITDKVNISRSDISQESKLSSQQTILIRDTLEYNLLDYASSNSGANNEPYTIYKQQEMVGIIFTLFTVFLYIIAFFIVGFILLIIWAKISGGVEVTDDIRQAFPVRTIIVMGIAIGAAFAFLSMFKNTFQDKVQPTLKNVKYKIKKVNTDIYTNMTDDSDFLSSLVNSNSDKRNAMLIDKAKANGLECLEKMIFTMSVFEHLSKSVQATDPTYTEIMKIFDRNNIQKQRIDITKYLKYGQPNLINNQYVASKEVKPLLKQYIDTPSEISLLTNLNSTLTNINKSFHDLKILSSVKSELSSYLLYSLLAAIAFLIIIGAVFAPTIISAVTQIYVMIRSYWDRLEAIKKANELEQQAKKTRI